MSALSHAVELRSRAARKHVYRAFVVVALGALVVRAGSVVRELVVARQFGVSGGMDAFATAYAVPAFAVSVLAGSLSAAFLPAYIRVRIAAGPDAGVRLLRAVLSFVLAALGIASVGIIVLVPHLLRWIAPGYSPHKAHLAASLCLLMLPLIVCSGLATILAAVLNAERRFGVAAIVPILSPLLVVAFVLSIGGSVGVRSLAIGFSVGAAVELAALALVCHHRRCVPLPGTIVSVEGLSAVVKQWLPAAAGALITSTSPIVDQAMASTLGPGSVAELTYGSRFVVLFLSVGALAVGTAVLPFFSEAVASRDFQLIRASIARYAALIAVLTIPITIVVATFSRQLTAATYQRGAFTAADAAAVAHVQRLFILQLPFYVIGILLVRLIAALAANGFLMIGALVNVVVNIGGNFLLMSYLGVAGIALATALMYAVSALYLALVLRWRLRVSERRCMSFAAV